MATQAKREYTATFFAGIDQDASTSAAAVVPVISELVRPASVLDVGCGIGTWLAEWIRQGTTDVLGLDGDYVDRAALRIAEDRFVATDLQKPFSLGRKFDLVQTLEVAEHIDEAYADTFVDSLTRHGDVILFSAAIPGQGGTHHVNEQWPSYWAEKFARADYTPYDVIRPLIWTNSQINSWYRQNILIFAKGRTFGGTDTRLDLVHPESWRNGIDYRQHPRQVLRSVPDAVATILRRKLARG